MNALAFEIRLDQPVLAGQPHSGEANSNISYTFLPGSMLRGALASCYSGGKSVNLSEDPKFASLFLNGKVRFLNAYPINPDGNIRMLPRPFSWFVKKAEINDPDAVVYDLALVDLKTDDPVKPPPGDFFFHLGNAVKLMTPALDVTVHNASSDRNRKKEGSSQVYRYDTLSAGQFFGALILSESMELLQTLKELLESSHLVLGGSANGGYGRVEVLKPLYINSEWSEDQDYPHAAPNSTRDVYLTCLSDVIYRGPDGAVDFDLKTLAGKPPKKAFRRERMVGGFNRKWGLPTLQEWAIEAGSVFVFPAECRAALEEKIQSGVGERLTEGFGRFALDLHTAPEFRRSAMIPKRTVASPLPKTLSPLSQEYAQSISNRRLQNELDRIVMERIYQWAGQKQAFSHLPRAAQLSRARLAARDAWQTGDLNLLQKHFQGLSELSLRSWKNASLGGESLKDWILRRVDDPSLESFNLGVVSFAGVKADFSPQKRAQLVARLIEGVLKLAVEYAKQEGENS